MAPYYTKKEFYAFFNIVEVTHMLTFGLRTPEQVGTLLLPSRYRKPVYQGTTFFKTLTSGDSTPTAKT